MQEKRNITTQVFLSGLSWSVENMGRLFVCL